MTLCLITATSLLALLGVRYPVRLLPLLLFESAWKALWPLRVAVPQAADGGLDTATSDVVVSCSLVVVILAVIPWRHVWQSHALTPGETWRREARPAAPMTHLHDSTSQATRHDHHQ